MLSEVAFDHFKRHVSGTGIFYFRNNFLENTNGIMQYCLSNTSYSNKAVISLTHGIEYQYQYDNNKTCIDVKTDVKFTLTNGKETIEFDGTNFTVKSGDCASPSESVATLILTTVKEDLLTLEFKTNAQKEASMGAMFTFSPDEYFPGTPKASEYFVCVYFFVLDVIHIHCTSNLYFF